MRRRSPASSEICTFPGSRTSVPSASPAARPRISVLHPQAPGAPPSAPYGGRSRRSDNSVTDVAVSISYSRTMPSPPRKAPAPPLPLRRL